MPLLYPDVNNARTSYCSIEFGFPGRLIPGIKSINYKDNGEIPKIMGTNAVPIGRVRGKADAEGDVEFYQKEWDSLLPILTQGGLVGYMEIAWPITVTYAEPSNLIDTRTDKLVGVRFFGAEKSNSEGTDALTVKLQMSIMRIQWHGRFVALRF